MFVADAHCDALFRRLEDPECACTVTREALARGGVGAQAFALFAGDDGRASFDRARRMLKALGALGVPLLDGPLPDLPPDSPHALITIEGGELLEGDAARLEALDRAVRVRMLGLTWNFENELGYPAMGGDARGLKPGGFALLREMDRLGVLADVSHLNEAGFWDVCERAQLPPVASHSNCRWLCDVPRNLRIEQARALIERGGFIGINFYAGFLREDGRASVDDVVRHIDALMELGGEKCVGFGSDFDGISVSPQGLASPADFPRLLDALSRRGYAPSQIEDIAGLNLYRLLRRADRARAA